jgi:TM2 domain-containing membrane protein YozV
MALCNTCNINLPDDVTFCPQCGQGVAYLPAEGSAAHEVVIVQQVGSPKGVYYYDPDKPKKSKILAGWLAILLGGFGVHKFYLGKLISGIIYPVCWIIPGLLLLVFGMLSYATLTTFPLAGLISACLGCVTIILIALPFLFSIYEGIRYLTQDQETFDRKFNPHCFR